MKVSFIKICEMYFDCIYSHNHDITNDTYYADEEQGLIYEPDFDIDDETNHSLYKTILYIISNIFPSEYARKKYFK